MARKIITLDLTRDQRQWLIGFAEAEFAFMCINGVERVECDQKDTEPAIKLLLMLGGTLRRIEREGHVYVRWTATGPRARAIMRRIKRSMSKRRQAQISKAMKETK